MGKGVEGEWKLECQQKGGGKQRKLKKEPEGQWHRQEAKKADPLSLVPHGQSHVSRSLPHPLDTCLELDSNSLPNRLTPSELSTHTAVAL